MTVTAVRAGGVETRNAVVDLVRLGSVAIVVFLHWISPVITMDGGAVRTAIVFSGPAAWAGTWLLQVMPLIFIAGGYVNTAGVDANSRRGRSWVVFLARRARRLVWPVLPLAAICTVVATSGSVLGVPAVAIVGEQAANPLWFLAVYLVVVALAPLMVRLHDRFGLRVVAVLALAAAAVDLFRFAVYGLDSPSALGDVSLLLVWVCVHQLGIVLARGRLSGVRRRTLALVVAAAVATIIGLIVFGPYPPAPIGLPDAPVSNLSPPTLLMIVLGIAQVAVLALATPWLERRLAGPVRSALARGNTALMTVYLWHLPAALLVAGGCLLAPDLLLPPAGVEWWASRPVWLAVCGLVLVVLVGRFRQVETGLREQPRSAQVRPAFVVAGTISAAIGLHEVWRHGLDLAGPDAAGAWLGVLALAVGAALLHSAEGIQQQSNKGSNHLGPGRSEKVLPAGGQIEIGA